MPPPTYSVLDLGSNSFHMLHAAVAADGRIQVRDKFKQYVSLGSGMKKNGDIRRRHQAAACNCLREIARVVRRERPSCFAAVATNAFRRQRAGDFHARCEAALGHPIRVLSSAEEGDYIYRGVVQTTPTGGPDRCILDIGGSSTELILGSGERPSCVLSWQVGSAVLTERFFATDRLRRGNWEAAVGYTGETITFAGRGRIHLPGIRTLYGASGAIRAVSNTLAEHGISDGAIDPEAVERLVRLLLGAKLGHRLRHLDRYRTQVFLGGLAVMHTVFQLLEVQRLEPARGAIREGVLLELHQQAQAARAA